MNRWFVVCTFLAIVILVASCTPLEATSTPMRVPDPTSIPLPTLTTSRSAVCASLPPANYGGTLVALPTFPPLPVAIAGRSQLVDTTFYSDSLGKQMPILFYLPPGYFDSQQRYPILYRLGGYAGDYHDLRHLPHKIVDAFEILFADHSVPLCKGRRMKDEKLLLVACSSHKVRTRGLLPAIERYDGVACRVIRLLAKSWEGVYTCGFRGGTGVNALLPMI